MAWHNGKKDEALWSSEHEWKVHGWIDGAWRKSRTMHDDACTNYAIWRRTRSRATATSTPASRTAE